MNYSMNARIKQRKARKTAILVSWAVFLMFGILIGFLLSIAVKAGNEPKETAVISAPKATSIAETSSPTEIIPEPTEKVTSLGEFKLTAYCPCEKCCGKWGKNRPTDSEGKLLVKTASGQYAKEGVTVAADTSLLPFGTILLIDDNEYIVQDRGGSVNGKQIDVYFESHEEALKFGVQYMEIFIIERGDGSE